MPDSIFKFILKYSYKKQIYITFITLLFFPVLYLSLELPKMIINHGIKNHGLDEFDHNLIFFNIEIGQIEFLIMLSFCFLFVIFINGMFKMYINIYKGRLGEGMLRQLRFILFHKLLRFPSSHFRIFPSAQITQIITAETEPMGGFIGDAFVLPIFQGGTLFVYLTFIFFQDPILGIFAISLYPIQAFLIPKLQKSINLLLKKRIDKVRILAGNVADTTGSLDEIHLNASEEVELTSFTSNITAIYKIRYQIFKQKFFIKFLNTFLNQLTLFFFYSIGGYAVIKDEISVGALVAVLAAYKDLASPWKELLDFYQQKENIRIKYMQIISYFKTDNVFEESIFKTIDTSPINTLKEILKFDAIFIKDEAQQYFLKDINLEIDLSKKILITGDCKSYKEYFGKLIARLIVPSRGTIFIKNHNFNKLPLAFTSRKISYLSKENKILNTSIYNNLIYPILNTHELKLIDKENFYSEKNIDQYLSLDKGNLNINYTATNVNSQKELYINIINIAEDLGFDIDLYKFGLHQPLGTIDSCNFTRPLLIVREAVSKEIQKTAYNTIFKRYCIDEFNEHATVIENLIFGSLCLKNYSFDQLYSHPYFTQTLKKTKLYNELLHIGIKLAIKMQDLFSNIPSGHNLYDKFNFVTSDLLCEYKKFIYIYNGVGKQKKHSVDNFNNQEKNKLIQFTFNLIPSRHCIDLVDIDIQKTIVCTRKLFIENIPIDLKKNIEFYKDKILNTNLSILENIIFGKVISTNPKAQEKIEKLVDNIISTHELSYAIMVTGLTYHCGLDGVLLSFKQCQIINIIKALLKNFEILIFDEALNRLNTAETNRIQQVIFKYTANKGLIWIDEKAPDEIFDTHIIVNNGRVEAQEKMSVKRKMLDCV